jgi:hypothetical protein
MGYFNTFDNDEATLTEFSRFDYRGRADLNDYVPVRQGHGVPSHGEHHRSRLDRDAESSASTGRLPCTQLTVAGPLRGPDPHRRVKSSPGLSAGDLVQFAIECFDVLLQGEKHSRN